MGDPQPLGGGTLVYVQKVSRIKNSGTKIGRTKNLWGPVAEQKMVGALGHWLADGTPSASAKRSVEQKMMELKLAELKLAEQKFGGDPRSLGGGNP